MDPQDISRMAARMRRKMLQVAHACNLSAHLGGGLSIVDITATLYGSVLRYDKNNLAWEDRDRFILSKGHGVLGYFSALWAVGIVPDEVFDAFQTNDADLIAHPVMNLDLGIESSNGSLGQGLSMGVGLALAAKRKNKSHKIYVLLGNGECNEGSVWEAAMSAAHYHLDNLVAIVDNNRFQSDGGSDSIMDCGDFSAKWKSFGWHAVDVDGHAVGQLLAEFSGNYVQGKPKVLIANTVKGKGVPFMEEKNEWHHNRLTKSQYEQALAEMGDC